MVEEIQEEMVTVVIAEVVMTVIVEAAMMVVTVEVVAVVAVESVTRSKKDLVIVDHHVNFLTIRITCLRNNTIICNTFFLTRKVKKKNINN